MSDQLSTNIFSISGRMGRLAYTIQNSIIMVFAFQYLYYPALLEVISKMQHNPRFSNVFILLNSHPAYSELLLDIQNVASPTIFFLVTKYLFVAVLRIIDLKRVRDILSRKLTTLETTLIVIVFSIPFFEIVSSLFLMVLPPKKRHLTTSNLLKEAHEKDLQEAQKEQLLKLNKELFESGRISKIEYMKAREKYK